MLNITRAKLFDNVPAKTVLIFGVGCLFFAVFLNLIFFVFKNDKIPDGYAETTGVVVDIKMEMDNNKWCSIPIDNDSTL